MTYRKGDIVHVLAEVRRDFDPAVENYVELAILNHMPHSDDWLSVRAEKLTLVTRKFNVGDEVDTARPEPYFRGVVVSIRGDWAWLEGGSGAMQSVQIANLRKPPAPPQDEPAPNTAETFEGGLRVSPKLFGDVPSVEGAGTTITYTTAAGDTLEAMAYVFQTSVDTIKTMNQAVNLDAPLPAGLALQVNDNRFPF